MHAPTLRQRSAGFSFLSSILPFFLFHISAPPSPKLCLPPQHSLFRGRLFIWAALPRWAARSLPLFSPSLWLSNHSFICSPHGDWGARGVRKGRAGGIIFSHLSEMMTWLLSSDHALQPVFYSPDRLTSLSLHLFYSLCPCTFYRAD